MSRDVLAVSGNSPHFYIRRRGSYAFRVAKWHREGERERE